MIDNLSILLSHGLLALLFWLLISRDDLDSEPPAPMDDEPEGFSRGRISPSAANKAKGSRDA